jgi:cyclophilin family peptidyl-prolyl cis-trans isomerase
MNVSVAAAPHAPKLLRALAAAEQTLDYTTKPLADAAAGSSEHTWVVAPNLQGGGVRLANASTEAARAGLDVLMEDLSGAASALVATSKLARVTDKEPTIPPDVIARTTQLRADIDRMITDMREFLTTDPDAPPPVDPPKTDPPPTKGGGGPTPKEPTKPGTDPSAGELIGGPVPSREPGKLWADPPKMTIDPDGTYVAKLATTDGLIGVELLPKVAPNAVNNFVFLAREGFYDKVPIHRNVPGFMMQSGDPTGTGLGGPGYDLTDDPVPADMKYTKGVVAMANSGAPNSGGSQFFIMHDEVPLPPNYSIFGRVVEGLDVLDKIAARRVVDNGQGEQSKPVEQIGIQTVTVDGP